MPLTPRGKIALLAIGLLLFFLAVVIVVMPTVLVNRSETKAAVERYLSEAWGGQVRFDRVSLTFFPRVCATASDVRLDLPERGSAQAAEIDLCLKLLPLLRGRLVVDTAKVRSPDIDLPFRALGLPAGRSVPVGPRQLLSAAIAGLQRVPDCTIEFIDARLAFSSPDGNRFEFRRLNLQLQRHGAGLQWTLSGESDFLKAVSSTARLDMDSVRGPLSIKVADFQPRKVYAFLWPDAPLQLLDANVDLDVALSLEGPDQLKASLQGRAPVLSLRGVHEETPLNIDRLKADLALSPERLSVSVPELTAGYPRAVLELSLVVDEESHPRIAIRLKGRGDAGAAREVAMGLLHEVPLAGRVCNVLRGGEVPDIQVDLHGDTWHDLTNLQNLVIQGRLENGRIRIPFIDLDLDEVHGNARIAGGFIEGDRLKGHSGGMRAESGTMRLGLSRSEPLIKLDLFAGGQLAMLPQVLPRVVKNPAFLKGIERVQEFSGTARGRLRLDGTYSDISVRVEAADLDIQGRYEPIPFPLQFKGDRFVWQDHTIRFEGWDLSIGQSVVSGMGGAVDWTEAVRLSLGARRAELSLGETHKIVNNLADDHTPLRTVEPISGRAALHSIESKAYFRPDGGMLGEFSAAIDNAVIDSAGLRLPLTLHSGRLALKGSGIDLSGMEAVFGRSVARSLSVRAGWDRADMLDVRADSAVMDCAELFPQLVGLSALPWLAEDISGLQGTISLSDVRSQGPIRDLHGWRVEAHAAFKDVVVTTTFLDQPIELPSGRLAVSASNPEAPGSTTLRMDAARVRIGRDEALLAGEATASAAELRLNLSITAEAADGNTIAKISERIAQRRGRDRRPVKGRLHLRAERLAIGRFQLYPFYAQAILAEETRIEIERSSFCGMLFIGRLAFDGPLVDAYLVPVVDVMPLDRVVSCLTQETSIYTGNFNLNGALKVKARREDLVKALNGELLLVAEDGTIRQSVFFARLFALLNLTEIYRGTLPDFSSRGLDYKRMSAAIEVKEGKVLVNNWSIDGRTVWIGSRGEIDIATKEIDFTVMVSPFKTIDRIINSIPGLRWILGGRLVAIPMKAVGHLEDPQIVPLSPAAVGTSILEMIERTLMLPIEIFQPLVPGIEGGSSGTISR
jgi:hypothetical protein